MAPLHTPSSDQASIQLRADGLSFSYPDRRVLTDVSLTVGGDERVGLIGENGSGKSTLLRLLAGALRADVGTVTLTGAGGPSPRVGLLHQEPPFAAEATVARALEDAVAPSRRALAEIDAAASAMASGSEAEAATYSDALETAERLEAWSIDSRVHETLAGLGLADVDVERPTATLSGGQRSRLSLAWVLLSRPDVLLLDEPTNHVDDAAAAHLASTLRSWRGPVVLASHDRAFLDDVATALVDLDPSPAPHRAVGAVDSGGPTSGVGATRFGGSFTDYLGERDARRNRWERQYRDEQAELRRLRAAARDSHQVGHSEWKPRTEGRAAKKFYADRNATAVARRVNDVQSRLDTLEERQIRKPPHELQFAGLSHPRRSPASTSGVAMRATRVAFEGRLAPTTLAVAPGQHLLITGANGTGKSTLLMVLAGLVPPTQGAASAGPGLSVGLLAQDPRIADPRGRGEGLTAREAYDDTVRAGCPPLTAHGLLHARDLDRPVATLSVGQRRRLALAIVLADPPDVLLLDEPTNHLSLALATALEEAIASHAGTVIVASHDRWLRERWAGARLDLTPPDAVSQI